MSLWTLMVVMSGGTALAGAVVGAERSGGGVVRVLLGIALGLVLGLLSVYVCKRVGRRVYRYAESKGEASPAGLRGLHILYVLTGFWILVFSVPVCEALTESLLRLVRP